MTISESVAPAITQDREPRLVLNPAISIVQCSDNELFLKSGSRSTSTHRIEDTKGRGSLARFALAFQEASTVAQAAGLAGIHEPDAAEFAEHLLEGKALITENSAHFGYFLAGLGAAQVPQNVHATVIGSGRIAESVSRHLGDMLGTPLQRTGDVIEAFEGYDFVVVASDSLQPGLFYDADEAAAETGTPWQLVYADGGEVVVGPTFIPGLTADYYAMDTLDEAGRTMRMDYQFLKSAIPAVQASAQVPLMVADLAASYASMATMQHLSGVGSYLENHLLRIDLERMHVIRDRVLRLARTPRDLASRDDLRHPFL